VAPGAQFSPPRNRWTAGGGEAAEFFRLMQQFAVFDTQSCSSARQARRVGNYLRKETVILFIREMNDECVQKLTQQGVDFLFRRHRPGQHAVNPLYLTSQGFVFVKDSFQGFRLHFTGD
jgi:hypothetical protein